MSSPSSRRRGRRAATTHRQIGRTPARRAGAAPEPSVALTQSTHGRARRRCLTSHMGHRTSMAATPETLQTIEKRIYESANTLVYRSRLGDRSVIVKQLKPATAGPGAIARYHHEFAINQSLTSPHVVHALELHAAENRIVFEDVGGVALRELIRDAGFDL